MLSKYEIQANDFARKYGVKLKVVSTSYGKHFPEDTQSRHIFTIRLSRNRKSYTFNFGQSIAAGAKEPTMYDVLTCLQKYDVGNYQDFCSEFGYDLWDDNGRTNKISHRIYLNVCKEFYNVDRLFNDVIEELSEIQ